MKNFLIPMNKKRILMLTAKIPKEIKIKVHRLKVEKYKILRLKWGKIRMAKHQIKT